MQVGKEEGVLDLVTNLEMIEDLGPQKVVIGTEKDETAQDLVTEGNVKMNLVREVGSTIERMLQDHAAESIVAKKHHVHVAKINARINPVLAVEINIAQANVLAAEVKQVLHRKTTETRPSTMIQTTL